MAQALTLVLDRREMMVTLSGQALHIEQPDKDVTHVPLGLLAQVIIHGGPMVSCDVWRALAERNVAAVLFPGRGRGGPAWLGAGLSSGVGLRLAQHRAFADEKKRLELARWSVLEKLSAQKALIRGLAREETEGGPALPPGSLEGEQRALALTRAMDVMTVQLEKISSAANHSSLMGHEGTASAS